MMIYYYQRDVDEVYTHYLIQAPDTIQVKLKTTTHCNTNHYNIKKAKCNATLCI